jgi:hypothetical protein
MNHFYSEVMHYVGRMGPHQWFWVLAAMIVVGVVFLRGFGSRSQY